MKSPPPTLRPYILTATILAFAAVVFAIGDTHGRFAETRGGLLAIVFVALLLFVSFLYPKSK